MDQVSLTNNFLSFLRFANPKYKDYIYDLSTEKGQYIHLIIEFGRLKQCPKRKKKWKIKIPAR